ncbi:MAG TPA: hypothetical protein VKH63_03685 [Candidatus Acidoferrum sp.]|jgi:hypothetical protein|nr:hypothetical protein [Candidatus Acidoferrum sp.]
MVRFYLRELMSFVFLLVACGCIHLGNLAMGTLYAQDRHTGMARLCGLRGDKFRRAVRSALGDIDFMGEGYEWFPYYDPVLLGFYR